MEAGLQKKKLEEFSQTKPQELSLFEFLIPENKYSNSIELYDFIPKYYWGKMERLKVENHKKEVLTILERIFEYRGKQYEVRIIPATVMDENGIEKDYYPSYKEEIIEDALRKMVCDGQGIFLDDQAGITFSLYELKKELKRIGHQYNDEQIKKAFMVCSRATIEVTRKDGAKILSSHIFGAVGLQTFEEWKNKNNVKCYVQFNPLVTTSIKNKTFRQINYESTMSYKTVIARQLHKRMSHHYTQASLTNPYSILLTTIIRDFGLTRYQNLNMNLRDAKLALEEMKEKEVILEYKIEKTIEVQKRNKLIDIKFLITPHPTFSNEMRIGNSIYSKINK